jgi:hypothetical protein
MPPDIAGGLVAVLGVVSVGTLVLIGMRMRFVHRIRSQNKPEELEQISEALDALHDDNRSLREDVAELQERLDFHERLLTQPKDERVNTPV